MDEEFEFDDDLADEDLILAVDEASAAVHQPMSFPEEDAYGDPNDFLSDEFSGSAAVEARGTYQGRAGASNSSARAPLRAPGQQSFRQITLYGMTAQSQGGAPAPSHSNRMYRTDLPPDAPTHHALNHEALETYVYPTNLGPIRDYQYSIVKNGLFHNTLVALPTGLGKTFIAATVMLNYYRWTKTAKIVFVAPTKPLASQQVEACMNIAGIPRSQAMLLTGEIAPGLREDEWASKRLFFMTPQTLQNDLGKGYANPKDIVLLVVDEAHRATGDYAYVKVIEFIRRFNRSFRVLALTATPGSKVEGVQEVIDNLGISEVEIRTEDSIDIRGYIHSRDTDKVLMDPSDEILKIGDLFSKALKPLCDKLGQQNIYYGRDPMGLTTFGLLKAKREWEAGPARHLNEGTKGMIRAVFTILLTLAHGVKLLTLHGIKPFYSQMLTFRTEVEARGEKGSKYKQQIIKDASFQEMMDCMDKWQKIRDFVGHPKLDYLQGRLLQHFEGASPGSNTRVIVFSEYRDSAEEIVRILNMQQPYLKASIFVGQAETKRGGAGMKQKQQIETIEEFKKGKFNILVATSIGEEGLDIGQVDLIICYDASASPIRMLQRMGRTGRKRAGSVVLLLMKGKEERKFAEAQDNYEKMQKMICDGSRFNFRHDLSSRIVPRDANPRADERAVEIPIENTQNTSLPEPKKSRAKKASKKIFHMPDGVETGFTMASMFGKAPSKVTASKPKPHKPVETDILAEIPSLQSVLLSKAKHAELEDLYREIPGGGLDLEEIEPPELDKFPVAQRKLRPAVTIQHGERTKRCVRLFKKLGKSQAREDMLTEPYGQTDSSRYHRLPLPAYASDTVGDSDSSSTEPTNRPKRVFHSQPLSLNDGSAPPPKRRKPGPKPGSKRAPKPKVKPAKAPPRVRGVFSSSEDGEEGSDDGESTASLADERPAHPTRGRKPAKGKKAARRPARTNFEERGDDCMRTSDAFESDGSDQGSDLVGFIVGDDEVTSSMRREALTSPTSTALSSPMSVERRRRGKEKGKGKEKAGAKAREDVFFVPTHFTLTQASEDSLPDLSTMAASKKRHSPCVEADSNEDEDEDEDVALRPNRAHKRRQVFEDSETE